MPKPIFAMTDWLWNQLKTSKEMEVFFKTLGEEVDNVTKIPPGTAIPINIESTVRRYQAIAVLLKNQHMIRAMRQKILREEPDVEENEKSEVLDALDVVVTSMMMQLLVAPQGSQEEDNVLNWTMLFGTGIAGMGAPGEDCLCGILGVGTSLLSRDFGLMQRSLTILNKVQMQDVHAMPIWTIVMKRMWATCLAMEVQNGKTRKDIPDGEWNIHRDINREFPLFGFGKGETPSH